MFGFFLVPPNHQALAESFQPVFPDIQVLVTLLFQLKAGGAGRVCWEQSKVQGSARKKPQYFNLH